LIGKQIIFGAQPYEVFEKLIKKVLEEDTTIGNTID